MNKEAEELYPINSTGGTMEMLSRYQLNNSLKQEGFIAGANSKSVEQRIIQAQIKILEQHIEHLNKPGYKRSDVLNSIKQLKQKLEDEQYN